MFVLRSLQKGLAFLILVSLSFASQCYWPDGSDADPSYVACNSTAPSSACCGAIDACTTFGWCLGASGMAYRGGCTDQNWDSVACLTSYCQSVKNNYQFLMNCNGGLLLNGETLLWCCSDSTTESCCNNNFSLPFTPADGLTGRAFIPDSEDASTVTASTATSSPTGSLQPGTIPAKTQGASVSANSTASSASGVSSGAIAGASVGCAIGGLLLGAATAFLLLKRRDSLTRKSETESYKAYYEAPKNNLYRKAPSFGPFSAGAHQYPTPIQEAPSLPPEFELDGVHHQSRL